MQRIEQTTAQDVGARQDHAVLALQIARDYPAFGSGAGTFHTAFTRYRGPEIRAFYDHLENDYAQFLIETGLIGLLTRAADVQVEGRWRWLGNAQSDGNMITFYGTGNGLGMLTSPDGAVWTRVPAPPIRGGDPGAVSTRDGGLIVVITGEPRRGLRAAHRPAE